MKKTLLNLLLVATGAFSGTLGAYADDPVVLLDLTVQDGYNQCTQQVGDERAQAWQFYAYYASAYLHTFYNDPVYDTYLVSPEFTLEKGHLYQVQITPTYYFKADGENQFPFYLDIMMGQGDDASVFTVLKTYRDEDIDGADNPGGRPVENVEFAVSEPGNYKIAFHAKSSCRLANCKIVDAGVNNQPATPHDFTVIPDADGAAKAAISFTMPSESKVKDPLEGTLTYIVSRSILGEDNTLGEEAVVATAAAEVGSAVSLNDDPAPTGTVEYYLDITDGTNSTDRVTRRTWVGPEEPLPVTDLTLALDGNRSTVSWTAPTDGVHGATLDAGKLTYKVERLLDGEATVVAESQPELTFSEEIVVEGFKPVQYRVTALYSGVAGAPVLSNMDKLGDIILPFATSFSKDGAPYLSPALTPVVIKSSKGYNWEVIGKMPKSPYVEPYDGDGGQLVYNAYDAPKDDQARIETINIQKSSSVTPVIEFWFHHSGYSASDEGVMVQVSLDGGEWTNVGDWIYHYASGKDGWTKYLIDLTEATAGAVNSYKVGLLAYSGYKSYMGVDNLSIYNIKNHDLAANSISAPEKALAGAEFKISGSILNRGRMAVSAADYTYSIITDYPGEITLPETQDIEPNATMDFEITLPMTIPYAKGVENYHFALKVNYEADEEPDNNESSPVEMGIEYIDATAYPTPQDLAMTENEDGSVTLNWTAVRDPEFQLFSLAEDFETAEVGATDNINGWTIVDSDNMPLKADYYGLTGSKLMVVDATQGHPTGNAGTRSLGAGYNNDGTKTDMAEFLISPLLDTHGELNIRFDMAATGNDWSTYYRYAVYYTTEETVDTETLKEVYSFPDYWTTNELCVGHYEGICPRTTNYSNENLYNYASYSVPADAKHVIIQMGMHNSYGKDTDRHMWIDNILLEEPDNLKLMGYNVYENGVKLNDEILKYPTFTAAAPEPIEGYANPRRSYYITAVYEAGESAPTEEVITAAVNDLALGEVTVPERVNPMEEVVIATTVENRGNVDASDFTVRLLWNGEEYDSFSPEQPLIPGEYLPVEFRYTAFAGMPVSTQLSVEVSFNNEVAEATLDNNKSAEYTVIRNRYDIAVNSLEGPSEVEAGELFSLTATIANNSNFDIDGNFIVAFYRGEEQIGLFSNFDPIAAGSTATVKADDLFFTVTDDDAAEFFVEVMPGDESTVDEDMENNRVSASVARKAFELDAPTGLAAAEANELISLTWNPVTIALDERAGLKLEGYKVYRNGEHVADVAADANAWTEPKQLEDGSYTYKVSALYNLRESEPSEEVAVSYSGIYGIGYDGNVAVKGADSHIMILGADGQRAAIYNVAGMLLYTGNAETVAERTFMPGTYLVNVAGRTFKIQL